MILDADDHIFEELMRLHDLRRRIYRRFIVLFGAGVVGLASCVIRRAADPDEISGASPATGLLALTALVLGVFEAREVRQLTARMQRLGRALASLR